MKLIPRRTSKDAIAALHAAMLSLDAHCMTSLVEGLEAMHAGDLTRGAVPVTSPVEVRPGDQLAPLAEVFNSVLAKAQQAIAGYNTMREQLRDVLGDQSTLLPLE